jgi:transposase
MISAFQLGVDRFHFDTTSLTCRGAYENEETLLSGDAVLPPVVTHGYSKDHRGDLKQLMYGMLVSADGGVPVFGQVLDGNASDNDATAAFFARVRQLVKDPREVTLVADSKGWCAQVVSLINQQGLRLLSRLPRTTGLHAEIMAKDWAPAGVVEIPAKRRRRDPPDRYEYQGFDAEQTFVLKHPAVDNQPARSERFTIPVRVVRVFSPSLLRRKQGTLERITKREQTAIKRLIRERQHRAYACEEDAKRAAQRDQEQHLYITQRLIATPVPHPAGYRPGRGRPRRVSEPTIDGPHWRITYRSEPTAPAQIQSHLAEEAHFILIRTVPTGWAITDADMIRSYKGQYLNEHGFSWLKSGMMLNPVFLKTPHRIATLGFIYCLGLMVWNLIQRTVREYLQRTGHELPYYNRRKGKNITTRFVFELFQQVQTQLIELPDGNILRKTYGIDRHAARVCRALGVPLSVFRPVVPRLEY